MLIGNRLHINETAWKKTCTAYRILTRNKFHINTNAWYKTYNLGNHDYK